VYAPYPAQSKACPPFPACSFSHARPVRQVRHCALRNSNVSPEPYSAKNVTMRYNLVDGHIWSTYFELPSVLCAQIPLSIHPTTASSRDDARDRAMPADQTAVERARRAIGRSSIELDGASKRVCSVGAKSTRHASTLADPCGTGRPLQHSLACCESHHIGTRSSTSA
jgi:hypothetical protein